jgi:hypothetical protein
MQTLITLLVAALAGAIAWAFDLTLAQGICVGAGLGVFNVLVTIKSSR